MTAETVSTGGCLCGAVRFEVRGEPLWVGHCHCASCRRNTGSLVASFAGFAAGSVDFTAAAPGVWESSPGVHRRFCPRCGTPVSYEATRFPGEIHLYLGVMDEPARFTPTFHVHYAEHVPGFEIADDLPRYPAGSTG